MSGSLADDGWAFVIHGPSGAPITDHLVYFRDENDAQASAWRRGLDASAGYSIKEVPYLKWPSGWREPDVISDMVSEYA